MQLFRGPPLNLSIIVERIRGKKNRFALGTQHLEDLMNDGNAVSIYLNMIIQF